LTDIEFPYEIVKPKQRKPGIKAKATITKIELMKAREVYKKGAKDPEQLLYTIFGNVNGWEGRIGTVVKPHSRQISSNTKLAKFKQRYHQFPKIGMKVDVLTNAKGYWKMLP
jgi:hypothetical protein